MGGPGGVGEGYEGGSQRVLAELQEQLLSPPFRHSQATVAGGGLRLLLAHRLGVHRRRLAAGKAGWGGGQRSAPCRGPRHPGKSRGWGGGEHPRIGGDVVTVGVGGVTGVPEPLQPRFPLPHQVLGGQACGLGWGGLVHGGFWGAEDLGGGKAHLRCFSCSSSSPSKSSACVIQSM